jgi:hypothetical protein
MIVVWAREIPRSVISSDFSGRNDRGSAQEMKDANAAYTQALMWYFTGDKTYAKNAAGILRPVCVAISQLHQLMI